MSLADITRLPPHVYRGSPSDLRSPYINGLTSGPNQQAALAAFNISGSYMPNANVTKRADNGKILNSGLVSNLYATGRMGVCMELLEDGDLYDDSLIFAGKPRTSEAKPDQLEYPIKSIYTLNAYLGSDEGARRYGHYKFAKDVLADWFPVGFINAGKTPWQRDGNTTLFISTIVHGRTRTHEVTRAQKSGPEQGRLGGATCNEMDYVWLMVFKSRRANALQEALESSSDEVRKRLGIENSKDERELLKTSERKRKRFSEDEIPRKRQRFEDENCEDEMGGIKTNWGSSNSIPKYQWNARLVTTTNHNRPDPCFYQSAGDGVDPDSEYYGDVFYIGKISEVQGERDEMDGGTPAARNAIAGGQGWKIDINRLRKLVIQQNIF